MRALAILSVLATACDNVTAIPDDRLPPPRRPPDVDEGILVGGAERCGALLPSAPVRVSATTTDAVGLSMAVQPIGHDEGLVGLMWIEEDPKTGARTAASRFLLADGAQVDDVTYYPHDGVRKVSITALPPVEAFGITIVHEDGMFAGPEPPFLIPEGLDADVEFPLDVVDVGVVAIPDRIVFATIVAAGEDGDEGVITISVQMLGEQGGEPLIRPSAQSASAVALVAEEPGARVFWAHDGLVYGDEVGPEQDWQLDEGPEPQATTSVLSPVELRPAAVRGIVYLPLPTDRGAQIALQSAAGEWSTFLAMTFTGPEPSGASIAVEDGGARIALAYAAFSPGPGPATVRLDRIARSPTVESGLCSGPTDCIEVTIDLVPSFQPVVAALDDGYAVAWIDEVDGQRDVFYAHVACRAVELDD